ncbi:putative endoglucanase [Aspergillus novofumigatus IBT 16806]|uniref:AA9 family lytic polysaccharide monooxygenase n=1 Tax=Aspergillus novofumigatus (strain IBT 16806) TaxID=1392255 RepID=A0A2I1C0R9_ASPN1|nr:endo-beta-1,4-glucanase D [Aspergillus novofumigatus IBT 16806]PKX91195.1 endo-beta-1,4-glucanase D [Aspergillus novofumigatus IBT 16806]
MKSTFGLLALAAAAKLVSAHATVHAVWINDVDQGAGNSASGYIRSPPNNSPLTDVTSADMSCNVNGKNPVAKTLSVKAGDKVTFEWHHDSRTASDDIIASSHMGPVMVYMAPTEKGTAGNGWVKIAEEGYSNGKWAVANLIANKGKHSITVPDVPAGEYLLRPEIIALHEGNRQGGAQFYMECVQVKVTSAGTKTLPAGVSIPGAYKATDPGVLFDMYNSFTSYPIPGPAVWDGSSSGSSGSSPAKTAPLPSPTTLVTAAKPTTTAAPAATAAPPANSGSNSGSSSGSASGSVKVYQQCGGKNYSGATSCEAGLVCKQWNPYYHQCLKA